MLKCIGLFCLLFLGWGFAGVPEELIRQLMADEYKARVAAELELTKQLKADPSMLPALRELSKTHAEAEVRLRINGAIERSGLRFALHTYELTPAAVSNGAWEVSANSKAPAGLLATHSWSNGVLRIDSSQDQDYLFFKLPLKNEHRRHALQIDAEVRILSETHTSHYISACAINVEDDRMVESLHVGQDRFSIYYPRDTVRRKLPGWVKLRVVAEGDRFTVFVNDLAKAAKEGRWTSARRQPAPRNQVVIGDTTYVAGAVSEWRNVRVQIFDRRR